MASGVDCNARGKGLKDKTQWENPKISSSQSVPTSSKRARYYRSRWRAKQSRKESECFGHAVLLTKDHSASLSPGFVWPCISSVLQQLSMSEMQVYELVYVRLHYVGTCGSVQFILLASLR